MKPKVTVIVPIFNASKFIEKCAESLFMQTFRDIEYIFINDASTDDSIEKLEKIISLYSERQNNTKIINFETNHGPSFSKKTGIEKTSTDYLMFVDSDDYIDLEMVETMYQKANEEDADIVVCDVLLEFIDHNVYLEDYVDSDRDKRIADMLANERTNGFLCNKLIKKNLITNNEECYLPTELTYLEDLFLTTRLYFFAEKISKVDKPYYHYIKYNSSAITKSKDRLHFENLKQYFDLQDKFFEKYLLDITYKHEIEKLKVKSKLNLMIDTNDLKARKLYSELFKIEELNMFDSLKTGEKIMVYLERKHWFYIAQLTHYLLKLKNTKLNISLKWRN